jgi:hypothetical protein
MKGGLVLAADFALLEQRHGEEHTLKKSIFTPTASNNNDGAW